MKNKLLLILFFLYAFNGLSFSDKRKPNGNLSTFNISFETAENAYKNKNYLIAAQYFGQLKLQEERFSPSTQFKYAFSLYQSAEYSFSYKNFKSLQNSSPGYLKKYNYFFRIKNLWQINKFEAAIQSEKFIEANEKTALADSLLLPLADFYYDIRNYNKARTYYNYHKKWKVDKNKRAYTSIKSAMCLYLTKQKKQSEIEFTQILNKYKKDKETFEFVVWLSENENKFYNKNFFKVSEVYFGNKQYIALRSELERYIEDEQNEKNKEKARFNLVKVFFEREQYSTALYGFKNMLPGLKNKSLEPHIRLYLARILLRMGKKQEAIDAYVDYAERYPRRRISPEAVWKAAWISEEINDLEQAQALYQKVRKIWKRSSYARDAYFREAFTLFRLGKIEEAEIIFNEIRTKRWPDIEKHRAQYWYSLCKDARNDISGARELRLELARNMWDDYYTMKSYLMHKEDFDSELISLEEENKSENNYASGISRLLSHFEEVFEVKNVLGEQYAFGSLEDIKLVAKTIDDWVALAEIYKKLNDYGKAFRTYDYINRKFFADKAYNQKPFIVKERFPFYYDIFIEKYSSKTNIEPELVLALMKQESVFDFSAHSGANAYGLMQLVPATAREMATQKNETFTNNRQLFDPEFNIKLGTHYLEELSRRFDGQKEWILAAYNAGPHRVKRWKKLPGSEQIDVFIENVEFVQTRDYVRKVMKNYWAYKLLHSNFQIGSEDLLLGSL